LANRSVSATDVTHPLTDFGLLRMRCGTRVLSHVTVTVTEALVLRPLLEDRGRITVNPYVGARRQNETEMFSDHDETSPSIAAVSAPSVACSMHVNHSISSVGACVRVATARARRRLNRCSMTSEWRKRRPPTVSTYVVYVTCFLTAPHALSPLVYTHSLAF